MKLHARAATLADASAIDELIHAYELAYHGRAVNPGAAKDRLTERGSEPALVEDSTGSVLGFGHTWRYGSLAQCYARVHPEATGRGVGTALLSYLEQRATMFGAPVFTVMQPGPDTAGTGLLRARGYTEICHVLRMHRELGGYQPPSAPVPPDVEILPYDPDRDSAQLYAANQAAFPRDATEEDQWWHERCADPTKEFDPALWFVARQGDELVGLSLGSRRDWQGGREGYVGDVGVHPSQRGRGIAFALLTRTLATFAADGLPTAALDVEADNLTGAIRLYSKAGMQPSPQSTEWAKQLSN